MNCLVCNATHDEKVCPKCGFPVVEIPGDYEAGLKVLQPTVDNFRKDFAAKIKVDLIVHNYDITDSVTYSGEEKISFGNVDSIISKEAWLETEFSNVTSRTSLPVTLSVSAEGQPEYQLYYEIKNLSGETLKIGLSVDEKFNACVILKDDSGNTERSGCIPLIQ